METGTWIKKIRVALNSHKQNLIGDFKSNPKLIKINFYWKKRCRNNFSDICKKISTTKSDSTKVTTAILLYLHSLVGNFLDIFKGFSSTRNTFKQFFLKLTSHTDMSVGGRRRGWFLYIFDSKRSSKDKLSVAKRIRSESRNLLPKSIALDRFSYTP